ncbi:hypothetical protein SCLAR_v1c09880 [Spiroplasma clarkii]|uniref:Uncharacterized protein n=1 Tax=Spiroplasma clarkii TaxID=2139 RepID=A0A2K8KHX7_9MOLU|nr:hypothetical protein SCLAR_v1c09880 [Spiroplasma clarkii]
MCCSCETPNRQNCSCAIYKTICLEQSCCWCCFFHLWSKELAKYDFYNAMFSAIFELFKTEKHLRVLKKIIKKINSDLIESRYNFKKLQSVDFTVELNDPNTSEPDLFEAIEQNLIYKIRHQTNEWQLILELGLVLLDLQKTYFTRSLYENLVQLTKSISESLYQITRLFITVTRTEYNLSLHTSTKEKILDLEANLSVFEDKLANKLQKN